MPHPGAPGSSALVLLTMRSWSHALRRLRRASSSRRGYRGVDGGAVRCFASGWRQGRAAGARCRGCHIARRGGRTQKPAAAPAPDSTVTPRKPAFSSAAQLAGVTATRCSFLKVSFGTPALPRRSWSQCRRRCCARAVLDHLRQAPRRARAAGWRSRGRMQAGDAPQA